MAKDTEASKKFKILEQIRKELFKIYDGDITKTESVSGYIVTMVEVVPKEGSVRDWKREQDKLIPANSPVQEALERMERLRRTVKL